MHKESTTSSDKANAIGAAVVTTAAIGGAAYVLANSDYHADGTSISRDFHQGGFSNGESASVANGQLTTSQYQQVDLGFAKGSHQETHSAGFFNSSSQVQDSTSIGGFYKSNQSQSHETHGISSTTENSGSTSCCCFNVSATENTQCCTSDNCCGYRYELDCCGSDCVININSTCCCSPCIDACKALSDCLPNLDNCGNCCEPIGNACSSLISCLPNLDQVAGCASSVGHCCVQTASAIGPALQCIGEVLGALGSLIPSD